MTEFSAQTGGRYTYTDDIINLQNLALSLLNIFEGCDNFIVSGCKVSGRNISEGYIYLNKKLRHFPGATVSAWPQYIYESNRNESVAYSNGGDKVGRTIYGCSIAAQIPSAIDPVTNVFPESIIITQNGGRLMKDAFIGKYALLTNPSSNTQEVQGIVNFLNDISIKGALTIKDKVVLQKANSSGIMSYDDKGNLEIQSQTGDFPVCKFVIQNDGAFKSFVGDDLLFNISKTGHVFNSPVSFSNGTIGNIQIYGNSIENTGQEDDKGEIKINMQSGNESLFFRNTSIGNGKGKALIYVNGEDGTIQLHGKVTLLGKDEVGIALKSEYLKDNTSIKKMINWMDGNNNIIALIGYSSDQNNIFSIENNLANIDLKGLEAVDIKPAIKENGELLSKKYVLSSDYNEYKKIVALSENVYTKTDIDKNCAKLADGLSQFISKTNNKNALREHIGAISIEDVQKEFASLSKCLSDMASTVELKKKICANIGAAYSDSCQPKLTDSGWTIITPGLYVRQIGSIVSIQGELFIPHSGTAFEIPTNIDPPKYSVNFSTLISNTNTGWRCTIKGGARSAMVKYCNNHNVKTEISITYMV